MRVVEYTGGSTGSSLAMVCAMKGYTFHPLSSDASARSSTRCAPSGRSSSWCRATGGITPSLFDRFKARIAELAKDPNTFWTDQFSNGDALDGYSGIGRELLEQVVRWTHSSAPWGRPACWSACRAR